jgi:predicted nucleic acid-binding protein
MVIIDTSAWIEYFRNGTPEVVRMVDYCLEHDLAGIGDLIYCEVVQGIRTKSERTEVSTLFLSLPQYEMVGFQIAEKAAENYRLLRTKGITIRKTIDVIIGTFCAENSLEFIHNDRDFDLLAHHIHLKIYEP